MAASTLRLLHRRNSVPTPAAAPISIRGLVVTKVGHTADADPEDVALLTSRGINIREAAHPVPDENSAHAAAAAMALVRESTAEDLIVVLLSGGGSSLAALPAPGLTLEDMRATSEALLRAGCSIDEVNCVRKHCSSIAGGRLKQAARATGASLVTLVLSDVVGDDLSVIASGPTVADPSTFADCMELIERKYPVLKSTLPQAVLSHLRAGLDGRVEETLKEEDSSEGQLVHLVGSNKLALEAAAACLREDYSIPTLALTSRLEGEAGDVARMLVTLASDGGAGSWEWDGKRMLEPPTHGIAEGKPRAALLVGGETTVNLGTADTGKGGRNQEMAVAAYVAWRKQSMRSGRGGGASKDATGAFTPGDLGILCFSTDGSDGPTDATGAYIPSCQALGMKVPEGLDPSSYLSRHDAYSFFDALAGGKHGDDVVIEGEGCDARTDVKDAAEGRHQPVKIPEGGGLIRTGGTGTNVCDLAVILIY